VYRGAERYSDEETPSFWGHYDRVVCVNSMSKAYALSGTRIGWLVASTEFTEACWRRHEYAVIAASSPSMVITEMALEEPRRGWLINRQRELLRGGWEVMTPWLEKNKDSVSVGASAATALGFVKYKAELTSLEVAEKIRQEGNVLVAPGEFLGGQGHLRITNGYPKAYVQEALTRIANVLRQLGI
jgi:aspartate/methionine/tyrosine aminotransferase